MISEKFNQRNKEKFYKKALNYLLELIKFEKASNRMVTIDIKELKESQNSLTNSDDIVNTLKTIFPMSSITDKENIFSNYFTNLSNWDYWYENKDLDILTPSIKTAENKMFNFSNPIVINKEVENNTNNLIKNEDKEVNAINFSEIEINNKETNVNINNVSLKDKIKLKINTGFNFNTSDDDQNNEGKKKLEISNIENYQNNENNENNEDNCENENAENDNNENIDNDEYDNDDYKYNENEMTSRNKINNLLDKFTTKDKNNKNIESVNNLNENDEDQDDRGYIRKKVYCYPDYRENNVLDIDDFDSNDMIIILLENTDKNVMYIWKKEEFEDQEEMNTYIENVKQDFFDPSELDNLTLEIIEIEPYNESDDFLKLL